jgi:Ca-activated chloride channel homolog
VRPVILFACLALSASASVPARQGRDGGQYAIAVYVDLVVFNVTVTDRNGRHVSGLTVRDFQLSEDRLPQDITIFNAEDDPISVGLVIDGSGSMRDKRPEVMSAALGFAGVRHADDELFVVSFNEHASLSLPASMPFTNNTARIQSAILNAIPAGMTALYDALALGIQHVSTGTRDRKALVVVSDGGDNASQQRLDDVIRLAQQSNATIYTVGIYDETDRDQNPKALRKIASTSGGRAYFPHSLRDLESAWRDIAGRIRSQYTLGYRSSNSRRDGTLRKVDIKATRKGGQALRVTTRDGYRAPMDGSIPR